MSAIATRRLSIRHPLILHLRTLRALRTQAWPNGEEDDSTRKRNPRFKSRTIREIVRYTESEFDNAATKQQALRPVLQVRELLSRRPGGLLDMAELAAQHPSLADTVLDHPAIFHVLDYNTRSRLVCFTPVAQAIFNQEECLKEEIEARSVRVMRKLLMLSGEKRLDLGKIGLLAADLGLVYEFADLVKRHGEFFRVETMLDCTTWVGIGAWDPELAVSCAEIGERKRQAGTMSQMEMWTPKGYLLSKRHRKVLARFREAPFVSPYSDHRDLEPLKIKFERHAIAGMQELLNLTLHKSLMLSALSEFRTEFSFSNKPLDLVLRHPEYFYVSPVGRQETVFLRSAYSGGELAKKSPLVLVREQLAKLLDTKKVDFKR